jgi:hypothetical protein
MLVNALHELNRNVVVFAMAGPRTESAVSDAAQRINLVNKQ